MNKKHESDFFETRQTNSPDDENTSATKDSTNELQETGAAETDAVDSTGDVEAHQSFALAAGISELSVDKGSVIANRFQLEKMIGQGGMGMVWEATQLAPVKRRVAIKLIKAGVNSKLILSRFNAERQALALMDHPHIATIFDGGVTDAGYPYFVMELVEGKKITSHCDSLGLTLTQRIELFITVCRAIHHAHQKGIIHRDIKPSNVMVAADSGTTKVIDFGVAKATEAQLQEESFETGDGIIGTPHYMSPEQATFDSDIDTRSDVYSLGILLYELLTSTTPFQEKTKSRDIIELLELIRKQEPSRPSEKIGAIPNSSEAANQRKLGTSEWATCLRSELDWIVLRAIEKDRSRRYETANDLAIDLQRYLDGDTVYAHPPTRRYRLAKFMRRNRVAVLTTSLVVFALIAGTIGTTLAMFKAMREEQRASWENQQKEIALQQKQVALNEKEKQRVIAVTAKTRAEDAEKKIKITADNLASVSRFQAKQIYNVDAEEMGEKLKQDLTTQYRSQLRQLGLSPTEQREKLETFEKQLVSINFTDVAVASLDKNVLDPALQTLQSDFDQQPAVRGQLMTYLGRSYSNLGLFQRAASIQEESLDALRISLGSNDPKTLESMALLADTYESLLDLDKAEATYRELIKVGSAAHGRNQKTVRASIGNLAGILYAKRKVDEAEALQNELLELDGKDSSEIESERSKAIVLNNQANILADRKQYAEAVKLYRQAIAQMTTIMGEGHPDTMIAVSNMGSALANQGKLNEAKPYYLRALNSMRRVRGESHPVTVKLRNRYGVLLYQMKKHNEAIEQFEIVVELSEKFLKPNSGERLSYLMNLEINYRHAKRYDECIALLEKMQKIDFTKSQLDQLDIELFETLLLAKESQKAEALIIERVKNFRDELPAESLAMASQLAFYSIAYFRLDQWEKAEPMLLECLKIREAKAPDSWGAAYATSMLGELRFRQNKFQEAEKLLLKSIKKLETTEDSVPPSRWNDCVKRLVELYEKQNKKDEALEWNKRLVPLEL